MDEVIVVHNWYQQANNYGLTVVDAGCQVCRDSQKASPEPNLIRSLSAIY